jgi:hypothetical protein
MRIQRLIVVLSGIAFALLSSLAFADVIYKWEDERGHPHYSDVPHDGAEQIEVEPAQTFRAPPTAIRSTEASAESAEAADQPAITYESFEIVSPRTEETFWNTGGNLNLTVSLQPGLQMGHRIQAYLDGRPLGELPTGTMTSSLSDVSRGQHQVYAVLRDEAGKTLRRTASVTFFVQQSTTQDNDRSKPGRPIPAPTGPVTRSQLPALPRTRTAR